MITAITFLVGALFGAGLAVGICNHLFAISAISLRASAERRAYAKGYEDGSLPGQRRSLVGSLTGAPVGILAKDVEPTVLRRLAEKWVREGRRLNCHAWLPVLLMAMDWEQVGWIAAALMPVLTLVLAAWIMVQGWAPKDVEEAFAEWLKSRDAGRKQGGKVWHGERPHGEPLSDEDLARLLTEIQRHGEDA